VTSKQQGRLIVSRIELGTKRLCGHCGAKFYDLLKERIVCPKCATVFVPPRAAAVGAPRRGLETRRPRPAEAAQVVEVEDAEETEDTGEAIAIDGQDDKIEADETTGAVELIVPDDLDDDQDVGGILGSDAKKVGGN
jgi:uncharacterized protein (TIGR02300 family)